MRSFTGKGQLAAAFRVDKYTSSCSFYCSRTPPPFLFYFFTSHKPPWPLPIPMRALGPFHQITLRLIRLHYCLDYSKRGLMVMDNTYSCTNNTKSGGHLCICPTASSYCSQLSTETENREKTAMLDPSKGNKVDLPALLKLIN